MPCRGAHWAVLVSCSNMGITGNYPFLEGVRPVQPRPWAWHSSWEKRGGPHPLASSLSSPSISFLPCLCGYFGSQGVVFFRCLYYRWERIKRALKLREKELEMT